jgi:hypothetical protein
MQKHFNTFVFDDEQHSFTMATNLSQYLIADRGTGIVSAVLTYLSKNPSPEEYIAQSAVNSSSIYNEIPSIIRSKPKVWAEISQALMKEGVDITTQEISYYNAIHIPHLCTQHGPLTEGLTMNTGDDDKWMIHIIS